MSLVVVFLFSFRCLCIKGVRLGSRKLLTVYMIWGFGWGRVYVFCVFFVCWVLGLERFVR